MSNKAYTVKFTKEFIDGNLKGLFYDSELDFPTLESAVEYMRFLLEHKNKPVESIGGSNYLCHMARILRK